jgi:hypothetical protein
MQRELARKLGLKKGKASLGADDGLDELLRGGCPKNQSIEHRAFLFTSSSLPFIQHA